MRKKTMRCTEIGAAKGTGTQRRRRLKQVADGEQLGPRIYVYYFLMSLDDASMPMFALKFLRAKRIVATAIPRKGLAIARMAGHISYLSEQGLQNKFGRKLQKKSDLKFSFDADFEVESYLKYQGYSFVDRFDANSYMYITRAMDYFDLYKANNGNLSSAFKNSKIKYCIISFSTDWLYPTSESKKIVIALNAIGAEVSFVEIITNNGHDSFLVNEPAFFNTLKGFVDSAYEDFKNEI